MNQNPLLKLLRTPKWSPYLVGVLIGVLSWVTFAVMHKALGTSTTTVRAAGGLERVVSPEHVEQTAYLAKYLGTTSEPKPVFEWQFALVIFLAVGAYLSARISGSVLREKVPALWSQRFGPSVPKRMVAAFFGGVLLIVGARMAGGCTSGHGLSGGLLLSTSGWIFLVAMFVSGVPTAMLLFPRATRQTSPDTQSSQPALEGDRS